jgi:hypothetical protein
MNTYEVTYINYDGKKIKTDIEATDDIKAGSTVLMNTEDAGEIVSVTEIEYID